MASAVTKIISSPGELEEIRMLIERGLSSVAQTRLNAFINQNRRSGELLARANCLLSESLELQGKHQDSFETLRRYESANALAALEFETQIRVQVRLSLAYNYTGDFPKAIALLNSALRQLKPNQTTAAHGSAYLALSRVYRTINEYPIARDHATAALAHFRDTGDWRGLAESYFALALVELYEGEYEFALEHLEQVLKLVGDHPATYLLGMTYTNLAAVCCFSRRAHEGLAHLEKAVSYYETTEHQTNAVAGYNNLGVHLTLLGEWNRAENALEKALDLASNLDARSAKLPMLLDSMGELKVLRGELTEARELLERAVRIADEHQNKWYEWQCLRTLGKCFLAEENPAQVLQTARKVFAIGESIGDRQALREARLLIAEAHLQNNDFDLCAAELNDAETEVSQTQIDLSFVGELRRLQGILAFAQGKFEIAKQHFGRGVSIFEMLGDRYRLALAHFWLGRSFAETNPARAREFVAQSIEDFAAMGAKLDLIRAETVLKNLADAKFVTTDSPQTLVYSLTSRLTESIVSRELLLRELASVLRQETAADRVLILSQEANLEMRVVAKYNFSESEIERVRNAEDLETFAQTEDFFCRRFSPPNAAPAFLLIAPFASAILPENLALEPLLRVVELGLTMCAAQENAQPKRRKNAAPMTVEKDLLPDFIYASPVMERLVAEIQKIRSSDVTVLITGESGTGKELVANAVHQISARHSKPFIAFNCTAVSKDLSDAHLFGHRKGAFTGANSDSPGMIRTAAGGTLFLDEIGDLPLDIQPKLLRFLQEGEIQPLGEQRPIKVDVRVIAATNADLEQMVKDGRFREDLYYRLNVIRLHAPPLRTRRTDIPVLVNHYLKIYAEKFGRRNIEFAPQTLDLLMAFDWAGNVRQLCNEIQRIVARAEDDSIITPENLSSEIRPVSGQFENAPTKSLTHRDAEFSWTNMSLPEAIESLEREMIVEVFRQTNHNVTRTAQNLGITRRGLQLKLNRYDLRD